MQLTLLFELLNFLRELVVGVSKLSQLEARNVELILRLDESLLHFSILIQQPLDFLLFFLDKHFKTMHLLFGYLLDPGHPLLVLLFQLLLQTAHFELVRLLGLHMLGCQSEVLLSILLSLLSEILIRVVLLCDHGHLAAIGLHLIG